ncbi:hypothetical protein KDN24_18760, partial [Bacillus sp. Bva_UNVM-123]|uniref:hypothetical protein n=1 Tax=Bacillus sp. Bva_UNVM-123 TaxID=2829798 RepID=UPI00391F0190
KSETLVVRESNRQTASRKKRNTSGSGSKRADRFPKKAKHSRFGNHTGKLLPEKSVALTVRESNGQTASRKKRNTRDSGIIQANCFPKKVLHSRFGNQMGRRFPKKVKHSRFGNQTGRPVPEKSETLGSGVKQADCFPKKAKHSRFGNQTGKLLPEKSVALTVRESNGQICFPKKAKHSRFGNQTGRLLPEKSETLTVRESSWSVFLINQKVCATPSFLTSKRKFCENKKPNNLCPASKYT